MAFHRFVVVVCVVAGCVPAYSFEEPGPEDAATSDAGPGATDDAATPVADVSVPPTEASVADALAQPVDAARGPVDAAPDAPPEAAPPPNLAAAVSVPEGGPIVLHGASVALTHAFRLDRLEVTVGRFRAWDAAGRPAPCTHPGDAACELDPRGPYRGRMTWDPSWNGFVGDGAFTGHDCSAASGTSVATATYALGDDTLPVSCVTWYQAVAFCAFEGKRLPTETEWEYEASGRGEGRTYAWGSDEPAGCARATWAGADEAGAYCGWPRAAGAASAGASIDTALDLSGSLYEWVWDWQAGDYRGGVDYLGPDGGSFRGTRGGSWATGSGPLAVSSRDSTDPLRSFADVGFRCAETIP